MDTQKNNLIILGGAGLLLLILIVFGITGARSNPTPVGQVSYDLDSVSSVTADENTRGADNAAVKLIEYSDIECPFCQEYHGELLQLVEGEPLANFSWTYRHFPLTQIHPDAFQYAVATECAAEQNGFWNYIDTLTNRVRADESFNDESLVELATQQGLDGNRFNQCLNNGDVAAQVSADAQEAQSAGATGTPFSVFELSREATAAEIESIQNLFGGDTQIVVSDNRQKFAIGGSLVATQIREIVNTFVAPAEAPITEDISEGTQ